MTVALIAGAGPLPGLLAAALDGGGRDWAAWHLDGHAPEGIASEAFRVEHLGTLVATLLARGVGEVCFAGAIARPPLDPAALDEATRPLVPRILAAVRAGDDGALRAAIAVFEEAGLRVVGAQEIAPALLDLPITGAPDAGARADVDRAAAVHAALAPLDIGQACVVARGLVVAVEALPGTDAMLAGIAGFAGARGGVLYKAAKAGQDARVDMATVGPATVDGAAAAGLAGIAVVAGSVLVIGAGEMRARLEAAGMFLIAP